MHLSWLLLFQNTRLQVPASLSMPIECHILHKQMIISAFLLIVMHELVTHLTAVCTHKKVTSGPIKLIMIDNAIFSDSNNNNKS